MKRLVSFALAVLLMVLPFTESLAASKSVKFTVTVTCTLKSNNHVGDEWYITHKFNGKEYFTKTDTTVWPGTDTITLSQGDKLKIDIKVVEDEKKPDIGTMSDTITIKADYMAGFYAEYDITVKENAGRYSGNKAVWHIRYDFELR